MQQVKAFRKKTCKGCGNTFTPDRRFQVGCTIKCALDIGKRQNDLKSKRQTKADRERIRKLSEWLKLLEKDCNAYIRERDKDKPCVSCERFHGGQYHAGHFLPQGNNPAIRFHPLNIHKQCAPCNTYWSGNKSGDGGGAGYTANIRKRIGEEAFLWLNRDHGKADWTVDEIQWLRQWFRSEIKRIRKTPLPVGHW